MLVVCKSVSDGNHPNRRWASMKVGNTYFVEKIECINNQIYYKITGFDNTMFLYYNFDIVDELRSKKLEELGI